MKYNLSKVADQQLLESFSQVVNQEREAIAVIVWHLSEIDKRQLYAKEGFPSLFTYVVGKYHYSEDSACRRIQAARLCQKFPEILDLLEKGEISLSTLNLMAKFLTEENKEMLLNQVRLKSKREFEKILASLFPAKEDVSDKIRRLPILRNQRESFSASTQNEMSPFETQVPPSVLAQQNIPVSIRAGADSFKTPKTSERIKPITERRVKVEFSADEIVALKIERVKELLRHKYPHGKLEDIFHEVLDLFLERRDPERKIQRLEKKNLESEAKQKENREVSQGKQTRQTEEALSQNNKSQKIKTRYIPQRIRLEIWKRDEGRCRYVSAEGRRCQERGGLELDHAFPWSLGGDSSLKNLRLLCRTHNGWRNRFSQGQMSFTRL